MILEHYLRIDPYSDRWISCGLFVDCDLELFYHPPL